MPDLLGEGFGWVQIDKLYRCLDNLLMRKRECSPFLQKKWQALFHGRFDCLLYDLTSPYFESDPPQTGKRPFGYSHDKRSDCVQAVIALILTPDGLPLAHEVSPGNTRDKTTVRDFLKKIETQYGKRVWVMDRGIPTEAVLEEMRSSAIRYLVGRPKGRLHKPTRSPCIFNSDGLES